MLYRIARLDTENRRLYLQASGDWTRKADTALTFARPTEAEHCRARTHPDWKAAVVARPGRKLT